MNKLTSFQTVAYSTLLHKSGVPHFFNDTEFFREFYRLVIRRDADVVDVGFNIGIQSEILLSLTSGTIYGFEASKKIYDFSVEKFKHETRVKLFNCAVSNSNGVAEFYDTETWGAGSLKYTAGMDYCNVGGAFSKELVNLAILDDVLAENSNIGLIKMDIEGAEILALDGARKLIKRNRPFIVMEYCHNALSFDFRGSSINHLTLFDYAHEIGYIVYNIYGICLSNIDVWNASIFKDTSDVYLIPEEEHSRWVSELLPVYQYIIYDKLLEVIENSDKGSYYFLTALPSRIYEKINNCSLSECLDYINITSQKMHKFLDSRDDIFNTNKLSKRAEVLLALIYDKNIDKAYELGKIKDIKSADLLFYERFI